MKKQIIAVFLTVVLLLGLTLPVAAAHIFIDAASGKNNGMNIVSDPAAYSGKYIEALNADDSIEYTFNIESAGKYVIWARIMGFDSGTNSFLYSFDGDSNGDALWIFDLYEALTTEINPADPFFDPKVGTNELYETWYWMPINARVPATDTDPAVWHTARIFDMSVASHTIMFKCRETTARIDKLIITNDMSYNPNKIEGDPEIAYLASIVIEEAAVEEAAAAETQAPTTKPNVPQTSDNILIIGMIFIGLSVVLLRKRKINNV